MKYKTALISIVVLLLISAFAQNPKPAGSSVSRPLLALPLPEGRTLDEGHDAGFIDWSGSVEYVNLTHKDGICPSPCVEQVTRIYGGSSVSGSFAPVDVAYFEVMVAFTHNSGAGTAVLIACGSSVVWNLDIGPGSGLPGFVSMSIPVPAGCASWSLSASGGYVDFRSVDANYVSPPPPVSTNTFTPIPTETFTPSPTATETATSTVTETLVPGVTPSDTPTPTDTPSPTVTLPPGVTPSPTGMMSETPVPSNTPVPPVWTDTPKPPSSGGGQGGNTPVVPFVSFPTATQMLSAQVVPTTIQKTSTPVHASTVTPTLSSVILPTEPLACTPSAGSDLPWWILPAGMTIASALSLLSSFLKNLDTTSVTLGDLSFSPFGVTVPIPHRVSHKTTVGEWVMRPIRTMVSVMRTVWRTITEAVARFITRTRQVIDRIVHSEWVTTFKQVAKTFWENVTEKVPLLGWLGKVIGFIWKTVVKPVIRWVTEAIRTLRTWIENVVRWIVEKIQDGWNYITRQVSETIREWVEKTDWVRDWVTKEITVWETVWEKKFYAFPVPLGGGGGKLAIPAQQTWSSVLAKVGLIVMLGTLAVTLKDCIPTATPPCTPTPALTSTFSPDVLATAWGAITQTAAAASTQTVMAFTPTPMPTATATPAPYTVTVQPGDTLSYFASLFGLTEQEIMLANGMTNNNLFAGQTLIIPVNIPPTISGILANILQNERPTQYEFQQAWGALNVFGNPNSPIYPNSWWLADGNLSMPDVMNLVMQGEVANSPYGQQAVAARYIYYCGTTPDCNGNTAKLLEFLAYYHAWRESGVQAGNVSQPPAQNIIDTTNALMGGNAAYLQQIGLSGDLSAGNKDLPFHFANVSDKWDELLRNKLGRGPNGDNKFWVLTINELQQVCPSWGLASPDMTAPNTSQCY